MGDALAHALLVIGLVVTTVAALSGWLRGVTLSITVLATLFGLGLALAGLVTLTPATPYVGIVVQLALLVTLFTDALAAEAEMMRHDWRSPLRALALAMPLTLLFVALFARLLFPRFSWAECLLLSALLAPTDPVITSVVVGSEAVPGKVRHCLNIESGLNDGLAVPLVAVFMQLSAGGEAPAAMAAARLGQAALGAIVGAGIALCAGALLPRLPGGGPTRAYEGLYALGVAFLAFGVADTMHANGLLAAFAAGAAMAALRREMPAAFVHLNESVSALLQVATFFGFGALVAHVGWRPVPWRLLAFALSILLVARPAAFLLSFVGAPFTLAEKVFMAWFGPRGVASMLFALFVLASGDPHRVEVFQAAAFVILISILAHGLTDTVGVRWLAGRGRDLPSGPTVRS